MRTAASWVAALCLAAAPAAAGTFLVGSAANVDLGTARLDLGCADVDVAGTLDANAGTVVQARHVSVAPGGVLQGGSGSISLTGDWSQQGTFVAGTSTVSVVDGCGTASSTLSGASTFFALAVTSAQGKALILESGATQTVTGSLTLEGLPGTPLPVHSTMPGVAAGIDLQGGTQQIASVEVEDVHALGDPLVADPTSTLLGNTSGWEILTPVIPALPALGGLALGGLLLAAVRRSLRAARRARVRLAAGSALTHRFDTPGRGAGLTLRRGPRAISGGLTGRALGWEGGRQPGHPMAPEGCSMKRRLSCVWLLLAASLYAGSAEGATGLNVDFGTDFGTPAASYGAASGQAGDWNLVGLGVTALVDLGGGASGASLNLVAGTDGGDNGITPTNDDELLLHDNFFSSGGSGWSVTLSGLSDGPYRVYLYAPANLSVPSGDMSVGGTPVASIPGNSSALVEGTSWVSVELPVSGGTLAISGSGVGFSGLSGLQLVPIVPPAAVNVDFGTDFGTPAASYGAASGQAGDWNLVGLGVTALVDVAGAASGVSLNLVAGTDGGDNGITPTNDDELLLHDNFFSSGGSSWSVTLSGLGDGDYRVYLYAPANLAVPSGDMDVGGTPVASIPGNSSTLVEDASWVSVDVAVAGGALAISGSGVGFSGLAGLQLVPLVAADLNVDFGTDFGTPAASYAAAGQAGAWNLVGLGVAALVGPSGTPSGVSSNLLAGSDGGDNGITPTNDDELLLHDNFFSSGGSSWSVTLSGLGDGDYRVYLYAPANLAVPSGDMVVGGTPVASIPGNISTLSPGTSWVSVDVTHPGGALELTGAGSTFSGLSGLQVEYLPEPGRLPLLLAGIACVLGLARRRRAGEVSG